METRHSTADELIASLYGIAPETEHARDCARCAARLAGMRERRRQSLDDARYTDAELARQSLRWRERVSVQSPQPRWRWRLVAASAALAAASFAVLPRAPEPRSLDDARLFEDAFRQAATVEPASFAPMKNLFERRP